MDWTIGKIAALVVVASLAGGSQVAAATCVTKHAQATSATESSAKWFALETMVQSVSWSLWPGFVATGDVSGYNVTKQNYNCDSSGLGVTCKGSATFCKSG
ncbi:MAG: hypothetical protein ACR2PA_09395 [Hyphomicrobiaceae bacterium]